MTGWDLRGYCCCSRYCCLVSKSADTDSDRTHPRVKEMVVWTQGVVNAGSTTIESYLDLFRSENVINCLHDEQLLFLRSAYGSHDHRLY